MSELMKSEKMSDLTYTQTQKWISSKPISRPVNCNRPWQQVVATHNAKPKVIKLLKNGQLVKTITGKGL